jgi:CRISPR/Cas system-associated protein endoribonuclease Cas2
MIIFADMPSRTKKNKKSESRYDGYVFAIEILITLFLLAVIYAVVK